MKFKRKEPKEKYIYTFFIYTLYSINILYIYFTFLYFNSIPNALRLHCERYANAYAQTNINQQITAILKNFDNEKK